MNTIIKGILIALLLICLIDMPYGYYQFVRFAGLAGFAYLSYDAYQKKLNNESFIFCALALLFQPFIKINLGRTIWNIIDIIVAIGLLLTLKREK